MRCDPCRPLDIQAKLGNKSGWCQPVSLASGSFGGIHQPESVGPAWNTLGSPDFVRCGRTLPKYVYLHQDWPENAPNAGGYPRIRKAAKKCGR